MTTIRDLIHSYTIEILADSHTFNGEDFNAEEYEDWKKEQEDELINLIKERIVG